MKFTLAHAKKYGLIIFIGIALILSAEHLGFFEGMNNYCYDLFFRLRGPAEPDRRILIVAVDEQTLNQLGRWPVRRLYYARLLDQFVKASVVGFDIIMTEQSEDDSILAYAIRKQGRVVLPAYIEKPSRIRYPVSSITPNRAGHVHLEQDIDGVVRKVYHTLYTGGQKLPSFSSAIYETLTGQSFSREDPILENRDLAAQAGIIQMDFRKINFYGPPGSFPMISLVDIINRKYSADFFTNKIVLVGATGIGVETTVLTPFSQHRDRMTGIESHAHVLSNLIDRSAITDSFVPVRLISSVCFALLGFFLFITVGVRRTALLWVLGITVAFISTFVLFAFYHSWFSPVLFIFLFSFMVVVSYIFALEQWSSRLGEAKKDWEESFNSMNDAIVLMNRDGHTLRTNIAAKTLLNTSLQNILVSRCLRLREIPGPAFSGTGSKNTAPVRQPASEDMFDPETNRHLEIKSFPRLDKNGQCIGVVHTVRDITERKRLEQELLQAQKMESIGQLAGGMAHDFNNILSAIIGYGSMLQMKIASNDPLRVNVDQILESAERAGQLTHSLLAFSRKQVMHVKPISVNNIISRQEKFLRRIIGEDIELKTILRGDTIILADTGQIEQALMNLAANARDAMPNGGDLLVETDLQEMTEQFANAHGFGEPGVYAVISITDSGTGMDEETKRKLFDPFFTTKEVGRGTGLGLAIVYGIVKQHKGYINVNSQVGKGTTFTIYLPVYKGPVENQTAPIREIPVMTGTETILVAEDDTILRSFLKNILTEYGYTVIAAEDGEDAIKKFTEQKDKIRMCIIDMIMPKKSGRAVYDTVQMVKPGTKVIFLSGYTADKVQQEGLPAGCEFITKPVPPQVILNKIREMLDNNAPK